MRVEVVVNIAGMRGKFAPGDIIDWPDGEARELIRSGAAVAVQPFERAVAGRRKATPRKRG